jgi:hypothetical protein
VPFRLYVSDGGMFDIRHPEMLMVTRHSAVIGVPEKAEGDHSAHDYPLLESATDVDLMHITRLEQLPQPGRPTS